MDDEAIGKRLADVWHALQARWDGQVELTARLAELEKRVDALEAEAEGVH